MNDDALGRTLDAIFAYDPTGTVRDAIADWKEDRRLEEATEENTCREHRH